MKRVPLTFELVVDKKEGAIHADLTGNGYWIWGTDINVEDEDEALRIMEVSVADMMRFFFEDLAGEGT